MALCSLRRGEGEYGEERESMERRGRVWRRESVERRESAERRGRVWRGEEECVGVYCEEGRWILGERCMS